LGTPNAPRALIELGVGDVADHLAIRLDLCHGARLQAYPASGTSSADCVMLRFIAV
jgi:hypothetical protein